MAEELKYTSEYDGATTDDLLGYANEAKEVGVNAYVKESKELKSNEYVQSMKEQLAAEDAETVQVYDVEGVPHKISKKELISKAGIQLPSLEEIGGFVAYDTNGQALGLMSKEQVAEVVGGLLGISKYLKMGSTTDIDGILNGYDSGIVFCQDLNDRAKFIIYAFNFKHGSVPTRTLLSNSTLTLGAVNQYGTSEIDNGSGNYIYHIIGFNY